MSEKRITEENRYAGLALAEEELVARVAWCYYHDGLTQNDIGERLGLPRLKISRLLEKGRQSGVIRVQINSRYEGCLALESELQQRFGLKIARVLPALNTPPMNTRLGIGAAQSLMGILQPGQLLAVGFGEATMSCLQHLSGFIGSQQVRLVTLSGGVGPYMTGIGQLDAACSVSIIPAPLRVSSADVAEILRRESSVRDVILGCALQQGATSFNVGRQGALAAGLPVTVPGMTVDRQCSSGLVALGIASHQVRNEGADIVVAGGVESCSVVQNEHLDRYRAVDPDLFAQERTCR